MAGSRTNAWAMFTPNGLSVRSRMARISSRMTSSSPDDVSMIPIAPAFDTADASCDRAIHPIGACTIGISTPNISVTRLRNMPAPCHACSRRAGGRSGDAGGDRFGHGSAFIVVRLPTDAAEAPATEQPAGDAVDDRHQPEDHDGDHA